MPVYEEEICDMRRFGMPGNREHFVEPGHALENSVAHEIIRSYQPESRRASGWRNGLGFSNLVWPNAYNIVASCLFAMALSIIDGSMEVFCHPAGGYGMKGAWVETLRNGATLITHPLWYTGINRMARTSDTES